jgi:hypothetical protein
MKMIRGKILATEDKSTSREHPIKATGKRVATNEMSVTTLPVDQKRPLPEKVQTVYKASAYQ